MTTEIQTTGDALNRLEWVLKASCVLSDEFRGSILAWAYKAVELAYHDGVAKGKASGQADLEAEVDALRDFIGSLGLSHDQFDTFLKIETYSLKIGGSK